MTVKIMADVLSRSSGFLNNIVYFSTTLVNLPSVFNKNDRVWVYLRSWRRCA